MREPDFKTKLLGHPLAVVGMGGVTLFTLYMWTQDISAWLLAIPAMVGMTAVLKASEARAEYKAWRQAWDAMSDTPQARTNWRAIGQIVGVLVFVELIAGTLDSATTHAFIGLAVIASLIAGVVALVRRATRSGGRSRQTADADPTTICARSVKAPSLGDAYAELPEHCRDTLGR